MGQYKSQYTGPQIDAGINAALNPDLVPTEGSDALITSDAVAKVQQGFAPIETDATASKAYAIGDLLVWGGSLYKAKTAIAVNDSFTVGTNIETTTIADKLNNIDTEITSDTDTTLTGLLTGNGSKVGTKSLDTSGLTNDADHVPTSGVVKSAITKVETDLASIHATGSTNTTGATITKNTYFYLNNVLVHAKSDIASGATYTSETNYETVTAGGLNDLMSAFGAVHESSISFTNAVVSNPNRKGLIQKCGRLVIINCQIVFASTPTKGTAYKIGTIGQEFCPSTDLEFSAFGNGSGWKSTDLGTVQIKTNGDVNVVPQGVPTTNWYKFIAEYLVST